MLARLRDAPFDEATLAIQFVALGVAMHVGLRPGWIAAAALIMAAGAYAWARAYKRHRHVTDTPTSRIASAPQGYVELCGKAASHEGRVLAAKLTGARCVWFRYVVEERIKDSWRRIDGGTSHDTFLLRDGTGECVVDPDGAWVLTAQKKRWTRSPYRYTEWWIAEGDPLYALGDFTTWQPVDHMGSVSEEVSLLLAKWKADRPGLLARFDADRNGEISLDEWEAARREALAAIEAARRQRAAQPGMHLMRTPEAPDRPYLLSARPPEDLSRRLRYWVWGHFTTMCLGFAGFALLMGGR